MSLSPLQNPNPKIMHARSSLQPPPWRTLQSPYPWLADIGGGTGAFTALLEATVDGPTFPHAPSAPVADGSAPHAAVVDDSAPLAAATDDSAPCTAAADDSAAPAAIAYGSAPLMTTGSNSAPHSTSPCMATVHVAPTNAVGLGASTAGGVAPQGLPSAVRRLRRALCVDNSNEMLEKVGWKGVRERCVGGLWE